MVRLDVTKRKTRVVLDRPVAAEGGGFKASLRSATVAQFKQASKHSTQRQHYHKQISGVRTSFLTQTQHERAEQRQRAPVMMSATSIQTCIASRNSRPSVQLAGASILPTWTKTAMAMGSNEMVQQKAIVHNTIWVVMGMFFGFAGEKGGGGNSVIIEPIPSTIHQNATINYHIATINHHHPTLNTTPITIPPSHHHHPLSSPLPSHTIITTTPITLPPSTTPITHTHTHTQVRRRRRPSNLPSLSLPTDVHARR